MSRPRRLSPQEVKQAAADRRAGMTWHALKEKHSCAVNTLRDALARYSDEFVPVRPAQRSELEAELKQVKNEMYRIKTVLKKRFNLHL